MRRLIESTYLVENHDDSVWATDDKKLDELDRNARHSLRQQVDDLDLDLAERQHH